MQDYFRGQFLYVKQATTVFHLIEGFGFMVIYDPAGRIYIRLDPYYQNKVYGLCGNNDGDPFDQVSSSGIPLCKKKFIKEYMNPSCSQTSLIQEAIDPCALGNIDTEEVAKPFCAVLQNADYYGVLCNSTEEAKYYHKVCMQDVCAAANMIQYGVRDPKHDAVCRSAMALAHFCTQRGLADDIQLDAELAPELYCPGITV